MITAVSGVAAAPFALLSASDMMADPDAGFLAASASTAEEPAADDGVCSGALVAVVVLPRDDARVRQLDQGERGAHLRLREADKLMGTADRTMLVQAAAMVDEIMKEYENWVEVHVWSTSTRSPDFCAA